MPANTARWRTAANVHPAAAGRGSSPEWHAGQRAAAAARVRRPPISSAGAISQADGDLLDTKRGGARRGETPWRAVCRRVAGEDRGDRRQVFGVWCKVRRQRFRSGDEQFHRAVTQNPVRLRRFRRRHLQRRNAIDVLPVDPQNFLAGRQYRGARTQAYQHFRSGSPRHRSRARNYPASEAAAVGRWHGRQHRRKSFRR